MLATALLGNGEAQEIITAIALDRCWPTEGTRRTGVRNDAPRTIVQNGRLAAMPLPAAETAEIDWTFDEPFSTQRMVELSFSEIITVSRHLRVQNLRSHLNASSLEEIRNGATPSPTAVDARGRSAQRFNMEVVAVNDDGKTSRRRQ